MPIQGVLGNQLQMSELSANAPQHSVGSPPPPLGGQSSGAVRPRGGQNPAVADTAVSAGRTARNSAVAGASNAVLDINSKAFPEPIDASKCLGCLICDCEECKKALFKFISPGIWDQTWSNFWFTAGGASSANPTAWPGPVVFGYPTETGGAAGIFVTPDALLFHRTGRVLLIHRMNTNPSAEPVQIKVRCLIPSGSTWTQAWAVDWIFTHPRDTLSWENFSRDCQAFWCDETNKLTVFSRCQNEIPGAAPDGDQCSVFTLDIATDGGLGGSSQIGELTVGFRKAMSCVNQAGPFMAKLNLVEQFLFGYFLDVGGWIDLWTLDWRAQFIADFWSGDVPPDTLSTDYFFYAPGPAALHNFSFPYLERSPRRYWACTFATHLNRLLPRIGIQSRYHEVLIDAALGRIVRDLVIWEQLQSFYSEAIRLDDALQAFANYWLTVFPALTPGTVAQPIHSSCEENPVDYNRDIEIVWAGVMYEDWSVNITAQFGEVLTYYFPGSRFVTSPSRTLNDPIPTPLLPPPLPAQTPNTSDLRTRLFWGGSGNHNSRHLATSTGWRFCAVLLPTRIWIPNQESDGVLIHSGTPFQSWSQRFTCWFVTHTYDPAGFYPTVGLCWELTFVSISPDDTVSMTAPNLRHGGIQIPCGGTTETFPTAVALPIGENFYQAAYIDALDLVFWIHDSRTGWAADPMPMITVTTKTLATVYTIPASDLFGPGGTDTFSSDQGDPVWARAGQTTRLHHNVDQTGPLLKVCQRGNDSYLIVGVESYSRVQPTPMTPGTTYSRTVVIKVTGAGYTVEHASEVTQNWTYPVITNNPAEGPSVIRSVAIGESKIVFNPNLNRLHAF